MEPVKAVERLDQYVTRAIGDISRAMAAKLIIQGKVRVNSEVVNKPSYKLDGLDKIKIDTSLLKPAIEPTIDLPVIYEDDSVVVINKPVGILSHSKGAFNPEATAASWLEQKAPAMKEYRGGIVHRLDRLTSGVMILAKTPDAQAWLQKQFSQRKTKKTYIAVTVGEPDNDEAIIDMPIERNPKKPQTFRTSARGKSAVTAYKVIKNGPKFSLLELRPTTGRTHQLRVHLQKIGHPILGDPIYGNQAAKRMYLHALELEITLPGGVRQAFKAPLPKDFKEVIK